MIDKEYLDILKCPHCAPAGGGELSLTNPNWLSCGDCQRSYPVVQDIPVMLPEEGDKWKGVVPEELPVIEQHDRFVSAAS
jgi:uncharacterized protein